MLDLNIIQQTYFQLSGMKLKDKQTYHLAIKSPIKCNVFDAPICVVTSMNSSVKKSSRSTYLTERSSSRNKVMIPNSQKLASFFNSTRPYSSQKSFSTTSTDNIVKKRYQQNKPKIQFLKCNLNRDYFDQNAQQDLLGQIPKTKDQQKRVLRGQMNQPNSYKSQNLIRNESQKLSFPKVKHPNNKLPSQFFSKPIQKSNVITQQNKKNRMQAHDYNKCKYKTTSKNEFEYTFGLNY